MSVVIKTGKFVLMRDASPDADNSENVWAVRRASPLKGLLQNKRDSNESFVGLLR
jgi:hypothetical protein